MATTTQSPIPLLYNPTPLEEAYALYLLDKELGIPPTTATTASSSSSISPVGSDTDQNHFRIAGRQAVPFLTRSGVDRILLRTFWTIADPQNVGSLTNKGQFHVLLRLIAMTQAGVVVWHDASSNQAIQVQCEQWNSHPLPLPIFDGVIIPDATSLITTYWTKSLAVQPLAPPPQPVSISDAFGDFPILDAPLPPLEPVVVADATITPATDPNLTSVTPPPTTCEDPINTSPSKIDANISGTAEENVDNDDDEFGNFESVDVELSNATITEVPLSSPLAGRPSAATTKTFPSETSVDTLTSSSASSWLGPSRGESFYSAQESLSLGQVDSTSSLNNKDVNNDDQKNEEDVDDFGDFEDARESTEASLSTGSTNAITTTPPPTTTNLEKSSTPEQTLPSSNFTVPSSTVIRSDPDVVSGFNNFSSTTLLTAATPSDPDDPFSAFDALVVPTTIPLQPSTPEPSILISVGNEVEPVKESEDDGQQLDDDFGDFEDAAPTDAEKQGQDPVATMADESFNLQPPAFKEGTSDVTPPSITGFTPVVVFDSKTLPITSPTDPDDPFSAFDALVQPPPLLNPTFEAMLPGTATAEAKDETGEPIMNDTTGVEPSVKIDPKEATENNPVKHSRPTPDETMEEFEQAVDLPGASTSVESNSVESEAHIKPTSLPKEDSDLFSAFDTLSPPTGESSHIEDTTPRETALPLGDSLTPSWGMGLLPNASALQSTAGSDDPFAAFDALVAPQPELPPLPSFATVPLEPVPSIETEVDGSHATASLENAVTENGLVNHNDIPAVSDSEPDKEVVDDEFGDFMFIQNPTTTTTHNDAVDTAPVELTQLQEPIPESDTNTSDNDDFGSFAVAEAQVSSAQQSPPIVTETDVATNDKGFQGFLTSATETSTATDLILDAPNADFFSDFHDFATPVNQETADKDVPHFSVTSLNHDVGAEDDDFGDFEGPAALEDEASDDITSDVNVKSDLVANVHHDDFGDFNGFETTDATTTDKVDAEDFGDFHSLEQAAENGISNEHKSFDGFNQPESKHASHGPTSPEQPPKENDLTQASSVPTEHEDDFGDFSGFESVVATAEAVSNHGVEEHDFGDFHEVNPSDQNGISNDQQAHDDRNVDDFEGFKDAESSETASVPKVDTPLTAHEPASQDDDEWGAFHETSDSSVEPQQATETFEESVDKQLDLPRTLTEPGSEESKRKFLALIRTLSPNLPSPIRGPLGATNGVDGFVLQIETNVRALKDGDEDSEKRMKRCASLMLKLSAANAELAMTCWSKIMTIVRDELALGASVLEDTMTLSARDRAFVRRHLATMVTGLGEFLRICRSIVATVADLLCMSASSSLTEENWALSWCSISFLELALESERLWKDVQLAVLSLRLGDTLTNRKLESVSEIRTNCLQHSTSNPLCQLTLQPLVADDRGTKSEVCWEGKSYLVGAANLWANRVATKPP